MELVFLLVVFLVFLLLYIGGVPLAWMAIITVFIAFLYIALRYPRGKADWKEGARGSLYLLFTLFVLLLMVYLVVTASSVIDYPDAITTTGWVLGAGFGAMFLASIALPHGLLKK
jgi:signal transduction histidine kinase